ncbi:phage portal protein [Bradyrhizobium sp. C-145]|uniref:phage portal protein n=1 Tax=Bradyrhizobium sp. C-145 TaxID=574727 RepID=UPI00201B94F0|nr:phage portal protein [Bradyrhizobium sp. C-145]UQR66208.1 phage portal protein [Bradyrhizobium sp. C-145]
MATTAAAIKPRVRVRAQSIRNQTTADPATVAPAVRQTGFDAARYVRRLAPWRPALVTSNVIMSWQGELLRARARDVLRNNPHATAAVENFAGNLVGAGIKPSSLIEQIETREEVMQAWLDWTDECDADGLVDFYGMQSLIARALFEAGECFVRFRPRRPEDGLSTPLQLQVLESEMLPYWDNRFAPNGNYIMNGVEFDLVGRRAAYWFYIQHPGDSPIEPEGFTTEQVRVPANQVLHIFRATRPGQVRGVPLVTPAMVKLYFLDQYDDAELDRKKLAAMFAGFITSSAPEDILPDVTDPENSTSSTVGIAPLEPGTMQALLPGEDIKFSEPADVGGSYEAFQYRNQLAVFSAMGVPYMLGTGDTRRASYSSLRGVIVEYRRRLEQLQHNVMVFQFCRPVWQRWMNDAALAGTIALPGFADQQRQLSRAKWIAPRFEWVDPLKDRQAEKLAVDSGFKSRSDVIEAEGYDPEETDERIAADHEREKRLGLDFPIHGASATQPIDPNAPDPQEQADANQDLSGNDDAEAA